MEFKIVENVREHNQWDSLKGILIGILKILLLILLIPFLLIGLVMSAFNKESRTEVKNHWTEFYYSENLSLERIFINENDLPENLDYPKESNDIYLFRIRASPEIKELEDRYYDYQTVTTEQGVYLLSFNQINEGMTIWFVDNQTLRVQKVKDLESSWWNFGLRDDQIILHTTLNKKDINVQIETGYNIS